MAFPSIRSQTSGHNANSTTPPYTLSATINAGDLILIIGASDNTDAQTQPTGFTSIYEAQTSTQNRTFVFGKVADGTEDSTTVNGAIAVAEATTYAVYAIQDWFGTIATGVAVSTGATGTSANPDPDSLSPSWGSADTLWIAHENRDNATATVSAYPTSYTLGQIDQAGSVGGTQCCGYAARQNATATEDPATFTVASSGTWAAITIAIRPAAAGGEQIPNGTLTLTGVAPKKFARIYEQIPQHGT